MKKDFANRIKTTITATDRIGRRESITMMLDKDVADRLQKADAMTYPDGSPASELQEELNRMYDICKEQYQNPARVEVYFSHSQCCCLRDFFRLIYSKFYNYTLSISVK
jgi:hypothetical protein